MSQLASVCFNLLSLSCMTVPFVSCHFTLTFEILPSSSCHVSISLLSALVCLSAPTFSACLDALCPALISCPHVLWMNALFFSLLFLFSPQESKRFSSNIPPVLQLSLQPDPRQPCINESPTWFTEVSHCNGGIWQDPQGSVLFKSMCQQ